MSGSTRKVVLTTIIFIKALLFKIHRGREIKTILGGRKICPSTSVAQPLGRARSRRTQLSQHRESRRPLVLMHMGRRFINTYNTVLWNHRARCHIPIFVYNMLQGGSLPYIGAVSSAVEMKSKGKGTFLGICQAVFWALPPSPPVIKRCDRDFLLLCY